MQLRDNELITDEGLLDRADLIMLQDEFCKVTEVVACCYDAMGHRVSEMTGPAEVIRELGEILTEDYIKTMLDRVEDGSLEDLVVEDLEESNLRKIAVMAIRANDRAVKYWLVVQAVDLENVSRFYKALDFLRNISECITSIKYSYANAEAESRRSMYAQEELSRDLKNIAATTEIVQLLDSDEPTEKIMEKWISILSIHLRVDTANIFQIDFESDQMEAVCEWHGPGMVPFFSSNKISKIYPWLATKRKLVISHEYSQSEFYKEIEKINVKSMMVFPIICNENGNCMTLSLNYRQIDHIWTMDEIKFTSDAVKVLNSILARKIQKHSLASSYSVLEAMLDNVGCCIYVTRTGSSEMLFANKRLKSTFAKELNDGEFHTLITQGIPDNNTGSGTLEFFHGNGNRWYDLVFKEIPWMDGKRATLYSLYEITDKKLYQRRIEQQAYTDFLTGLYNRMCCERDLARHIDEAKKNGKTGAILYLDLDDFKHINDGLGHQYGDILLKSISHSLQKVDGIQNTCYRMGGDEFVILVPPEQFDRFQHIIDDINLIFTRPWFLKDADYYCTTSMGIVTFPDSGESVADLIKKADIAMYEAKKSGKNRIATYKDGIDSASGRRLDMEKNMRDATADGYREFEVFFQPIINVEEDNTECAGAEALIRWNSEKLGFISPAEFIPLAEYLGLINPIGNFVLKEACTYCKSWNDNGYPDYKVNVNLSVVQLLQNDIVETVERTIVETGINPKNLTLEVTESLAINDMERMKNILNKIKALGVKIALDDFGTGYSSLNHIREIPFDVIKVDQSFVKELAEDAYSQSFIKMIAELGETIGVSICVEGIETKEQYRVLQGMKVKYIQGYYFDRPMRHRDFEEKYVRALAN